MDADDGLHASKRQFSAGFGACLRRYGNRAGVCGARRGSGSFERCPPQGSPYGTWDRRARKGSDRISRACAARRPEKHGSSAAGRRPGIRAQPNWPTDPDVAAKLKEKAESAQPVVRRQGGDNGGDDLPLSIWTMITGKSTNAPIQPAGPPSAYYDTNRVNENGFIPNSVVRAQGQQFASQDPEAGDEYPSGPRAETALPHRSSARISSPFGQGRASRSSMGRRSGPTRRPKGATPWHS